MTLVQMAALRRSRKPHPKAINSNHRAWSITTATVTAMNPKSMASVLLIAGFALAGCSSPATTDVSPSDAESAIVDRGSIDGLYGEGAVFLSEFMARHPAFLNPGVVTGAFLFEDAGFASTTYPLPPLNHASDQLELAIFCDQPSEYEVALLSGGEVIDRTWGDDCSGPDLVIYRTAPFTTDGSALEVAVTVDDATPFRLTVLEVAENGV
jgi:hypothetical protein